jgi:hypothetical protein
MWSALQTPLTQRLESPERLIDRSGDFSHTGNISAATASEQDGRGKRGQGKG